MNNKSVKVLIAVLLTTFTVVFSQTLAFPTAEGAGKYTVGGRGGAVIEVTNLNDSGPGSLREGVDTPGPRTIVFRVSGTIELESDLKINYPFITIAGQTAPGDGICISNRPMYVGTNEVIIRHMRFRLGDKGDDDDAIWGRFRKNIIIDHCSASWSVDESMSLYGNDSTTIQWCIISESLHMSHHEKGYHGYGGIWGGNDVSFHHNLFAHHTSRTPRFSGSSTTPQNNNLDFRNNVIYNWGFNNVYGGEGGSINVVNNYYKPGPATRDNVKSRIVDPDGSGKWFVSGNYVEGDSIVSADNWANYASGNPAYYKSDTLFPFVAIAEETAIESFESVLLYAGATLPVRDAVDVRVVNEVQDGTATFGGYGYGLRFSEFYGLTTGIIDSQDDVGGWPVLNSIAPPVDSDKDGMPDDWETSNSLDPNDPEDRNVLDSYGYTMLENYLNSITMDNLEIDRLFPDQFALHQNFPNPFNPTTTIPFSLKEDGFVDFNVYDIRGRLVRELNTGFRSSGKHRIIWDGKDNTGTAVSSGIYIAVMNIGSEQKTLKMQLIK